MSAKPNYDAISQSKNVLVHQVSGLIYSQTDALTLSIFCGLKVVSIYSMYTMLFGMISTALSTVSSSIIFTLGQTFHIDRERYIKLHDAYELYYMTLVFALYSIANFFILPFMRLYTAGVEDINYIDKILPLMFISTYLLSCGRSAANQAINFAGHFKKTQNRAIAEAMINLVVAVIFVQFVGIYGVLIGTIAALLYRSNDIVLYASHHVLKRSAWITYRRWFVNTVIFVVILGINQLIRIELDSYLKLIIVCIPYSIVTLVVFFGLISLSEIKTARFLLGLISQKMHWKRFQAR